MPMQLIQTRICDGACCRESPRWPSEAGTDCIFRQATGGRETAGCRIMLGLDEAPETCPRLPALTGRGAFEFSCRDWPANTPPGDDLGGCCWAWVDGD